MPRDIPLGFRTLDDEWGLRVDFAEYGTDAGRSKLAAKIAGIYEFIYSDEDGNYNKSVWKKELNKCDDFAKLYQSTYSKELYSAPLTDKAHEEIEMALVTGFRDKRVLAGVKTFLTKWGYKIPEDLARLPVVNRAAHPDTKTKSPKKKTISPKTKKKSSNTTKFLKKKRSSNKTKSLKKKKPSKKSTTKRRTKINSHSRHQKRHSKTGRFVPA